MRSVPLLLLPALLLGGCSFLVPRTTPPPYAGNGSYTAPQGSGGGMTSPPPDYASEGSSGSVQSGIMGQWQVSTIDGKALEIPEKVTVAIEPATLTVRSGCIAMAWKYADTGGVLATSSAPVVSCRRGYFPQETLLSQILSERVQVSYPGQGGLELSANGHRVLLFRQ